MNRRGFTACFLGLWQWKGRRKGEVYLSELPGVIIFQHSVMCGRGIRQDRTLKNFTGSHNKNVLQ